MGRIASSFQPQRQQLGRSHPGKQATSLPLIPGPGAPDRPNTTSPPDQDEQQLIQTPTNPKQTRIDTIVACSPQKQITSHSHTAGGTTVITSPAAAAIIRSNAAAAAPGRRDKIYCDKWIHDGTCAFTQQGCKFKHEMPNDKETQEKLGLFHGYPAWWKKLLAEQQRPMAAIDDRPVNIVAGRRGAVGAGAAVAAAAAAGAGALCAAPGVGGDATVGPVWHSSAWRPVQHGPGHSVEAVEEARHTGGFGTGDIVRGSRGSLGTSGGSRQGRGGGESHVANPQPSPSFSNQPELRRAIMC